MLISISSHPAIRIILIFVIAVTAHFVVREVRRLAEWGLSPKKMTDISVKEHFTLRHPKLASLTTIAVSGVVFAVYFIAFGFILKEFNVSLTAYLASASVIGLAIGFGSQGLVQDVVTGLTLIFSDALNVEDLVEISGQTGRVKNIGLRFTTIVNLQGQVINIPNRNIGMIGRFGLAHVIANVDVQIPDGVEDEKALQGVSAIAHGMHHQHRSIIIKKPGLSRIQENEPGNWRYLRVIFGVWPGQGVIIENVFKQRVIALMKTLYPDYMDWMVVVTFGSQQERGGIKKVGGIK